MMDKYARFRFQPCLPLGKDGRRVTASPEHIALSRRAAGEGMVLLKNENNALPLSKSEKVALFGKATIEYIKGGGGSGDVHCPYIRNIYEGFKMNGVEVYEPLVDFYKKYVEVEGKNIPTQKEIDAVWDIVNANDFFTTIAELGNKNRDEVTYDTFARMHVKEAEVPDELIEGAAGWAETAVVTISRFSAEGVDRRNQGGDYLLSDLEINLLNKVCSLFKKVVVVINSGGPVDCEFFAENPKIPALLYSWQGGMEGGAAIADILYGNVCPSGKLVDTITKGYEYYPCVEDFHESYEYFNYTDDIYVGYRYFETIPGAKDYVRYPFGFGLSYTSFEISGKVCTESEGQVVAVCTVKNTGSVAGKEVVQLYYSAPQGKLGKPARELAAFRKQSFSSQARAKLLHFHLVWLIWQASMI